MSKFNPTALLKTAKASVTKHSPEILVGCGVVGMLSTVVLAVKATPKALELIEEEKQNVNAAIQEEEPGAAEIVKLAPIDVVKVTWKCYIPAAITGAMSIVCLIGSTSISVKRLAAITTAYTLSESTRKEYREKVIELLGEKKDKNVRDAIAKDRLEKNPVTKNEIIITNDGDTLCYDRWTGRYFKSDINKIEKAINKINSNLNKWHYVSLNDLYSEIGLAETKAGEEMGWTMDQGLIEPDFSSQLATDGTPCLVLAFVNDPTYDFDKFL